MGSLETWYDCKEACRILNWPEPGVVFLEVVCGGGIGRPARALLAQLYRVAAATVGRAPRAKDNAPTQEPQLHFHNYSVPMVFL